MVNIKESTTTEEGVTASPTEGAPLKVKRLSENAFLPTRGSKQAAGYDLYSAYDCSVPARGKNLVCEIAIVDIVFCKSVC